MALRFDDGTSMGAEARTLTMSLSSKWEAIEPARVEVRRFCDGTYPRDLAVSVAMVSAELLENAVKYGDVPTALITLRLTDEDAVPVVRVTQRFASAANAQALSRRVARATQNDAQIAYIERLQEVGRTGEHGGLGLARVAYEGGCSLNCVLDHERREVCVEARFDSLLH